MRILRIALREDERNALDQLSMIERRDPRAQAALLIREALERRGLLASNAVATQPRAATAQEGGYVVTG